jgi:hypothetical protein
LPVLPTFLAEDLATRRRKIMGLRQPARLSTSPGYGLPSESGATDGRAPNPLFPLLLLFVALAAAAVWFVAVPALAKPAQAQPTCEVIVLKSGTTKCVKDPTHGKRTQRVLASRAKR